MAQQPAAKPPCDWSALADAEAQRADEEAQVEAAAAATALGHGSRERAAAEKAAALKAAKAQWAGRDAQEHAAKLMLTGLTGGQVLLHGDTLQGKQVVHIRDCSDTSFELPAGEVLSKLFVERCHRVVVTLRGRLLTGHAEVWRCTHTALLLHSPLGTLQADLCGEGMSAYYASPDCLLALVTAGVPTMRLTVARRRAGGGGGDGDAAAGADAAAELDVDLDVGAAAGAAGADGSVQFLTRWKGPELVTERVVRDAADYPTTAGELAERAAAEGLSGEALEAALAVRRSAAARERGNAAFRGGDFAAAAAEYTAALAGGGGGGAGGDAGGGGNGARAAALLLRSNRAAAWLKLGRPADALADCDAALALAAESGGGGGDGGGGGGGGGGAAVAKVHFRRGLALRALGRLRDAAAALAAADAAAPGSAAVRDAVAMVQLARARARAAPAAGGGAAAGGDDDD